MASSGHATMHFPHLMHSAERRLCRGSASMGQTVLQRLHSMHFSLSIFNCKNEILLSSPYMAPRGHIALQKNLLLTRQPPIVTIRIDNFR